MEVVDEDGMRELLVALGERLGAAAVIEWDDAGWLVTLPPDTAVELSHDAQRGVLVMAANLGLPAPGTEQAAYRLLLHVSALRHEAGGLRMGLEPADDSVVQLEEVAVAGLDAAALGVRMTRFAARARSARERLAIGISAAPAPSDAASLVQSHGEWVRA
ncbi:type III secretion system chaperone [Ramlibacter sp. AN1015]|uniref:type III secretion system chaperone n=1 Tax=Ramlibacter sp. AN1015 TaxID=3133428 RepID=UPI0030BAA649